MPKAPDPLIERVRVPIEQAIARGESDTAIARRLGQPLAIVIAVHAALDNVTDQDDSEGFKLAPCGTPGAARRHKRRHEPMDDACRDAWNQYQRDLYARRSQSRSA